MSPPLDRGAPNIHSPALWVGFLAAVLVLLVIDLRVAARRDRPQGMGSAAAWSALWIALSLLFGGFIWHHYGREQGLEFFGGYVLEKALSVDNLFVFVLIFRAFAVPAEHQHRLLFWGVFGALVMRGALIGVGVGLVHRFHWVILVFGVVLIATAVRLAFGKEEHKDVAAGGAVVRFVRRHVSLTTRIEGPSFFLRREGKTWATPLFLALVAAESADLVFALDSIPAVFSVTDDSFLVFSSNVCAVLGLRALFFVVSGALVRVRYLKPGLSLVLVFVGVKMVIERWVQIPLLASLAVIGLILTVALLASLRRAPAAQAPDG
ncbi:MAG: TerC family protein [Myxococcales bacterium]